MLLHSGFCMWPAGEIFASSTGLPTYTDIPLRGSVARPDAQYGEQVWREDPQGKVRFELRVGSFATSFVHEGIHIVDTHSQALRERVHSKIAQQVVHIITVSLPNLTLPRI